MKHARRLSHRDPNAWSLDATAAAVNPTAVVRSPDAYVSDCLPEPPTPTSSAEPRERPKRRVMRQRCSSASWKKTSSIRSSLNDSLNLPMYSRLILRQSSNCGG
eukprot:4948403-Prymnesium_polylepis.1